VKGGGSPFVSLRLTSHGDVRVIAIRGEVGFDTAHLLTELVDCVAGDRPALVVIDPPGW
jgi:hypothetical protein